MIPEDERTNIDSDEEPARDAGVDNPEDAPRAVEPIRFIYWDS